MEAFEPATQLQVGWPGAAGCCASVQLPAWHSPQLGTSADLLIPACCCHAPQGRIDMRSPANRFFVLACEGELDGLPDVPRRW